VSPISLEVSVLKSFESCIKGYFEKRRFKHKSKNLRVYYPTHRPDFQVSSVKMDVNLKNQRDSLGIEPRQIELIPRLL
jgi:hypothetical protein